ERAALLEIGDADADTHTVVRSVLRARAEGDLDLTPALVGHQRRAVAVTLVRELRLRQAGGGEALPHGRFVGIGQREQANARPARRAPGEVVLAIALLARRKLDLARADP